MVHRGGLLHCDHCGAGTRCPCNCGAPYVPVHRWAARADPQGESALDRARVAIAAHPEKSNRAIAAEIGVGEPTVRRARTAIAVTQGSDAPDDAPDQGRVGRDGKRYGGKAPKVRPIS
jgi:hypothetical protein